MHSPGLAQAQRQSSRVRCKVLVARRRQRRIIAGRCGPSSIARKHLLLIHGKAGACSSFVAAIAQRTIRNTNRHVQRPAHNKLYEIFNILFDLDEFSFAVFSPGSAPQAERLSFAIEISKRKNNKMLLRCLRFLLAPAR